MGAPESIKDLPYPPDAIRRVVDSSYKEAKSLLQYRRRGKILSNLQKNSEYDAVSAAADAGEAKRSYNAIAEVARCSVRLKTVDRVPNSLAWVRVSTNLKAPENYKDKFFVPYLGESDAQQNFSNTLAADADVCLVEQYAEDDISDAENTVRVTPVAGDAMTNSSVGAQSNLMAERDDLRSTIGTTKSLHGAVEGKVSEAAWARAAKRLALERIMKELRLKSTQKVAGVIADSFGMRSSSEVISCYQNVLYRRRAYKESDQEHAMRQKQKRELLGHLREEITTGPGEAMRGDSIPFFFCRQCYVYNCLEHGTQTAKPSKTPPDRSRKDTATKQLADQIESRCQDKLSNACSCQMTTSVECSEWWSRIQDEKTTVANIRAVILELFRTFGNDPCRISEVARIILREGRTAEYLSCSRVGFVLGILDESRGVSSSGLRRNARRSKKKGTKSYRTRAPRGETESMKGGQRVDYAPCQHDGPCTMKSCRCVENGVNCEKYCSCNHNRSQGGRSDKKLACSHAFQGCTCKSAIACNSNACVCYSYGRECDPDLCRACHDCKEGQKERSCRNVGLLMGERHQTVVGHSDTHGWGAFATTGIAKGDLIGEYVGEVVSHTDADRRGRLYDEIDYSFLFNITENWALDSTRLGNKLRYCNHHLKPNCSAKLMRVGGDVRVGLYALRDIGKNEELFFDYKYKNGPAWSMPGADGGSASRAHGIGEGSAKKRACADNEEQDEILPIPKKRRGIEKRDGTLLLVNRNASRNGRRTAGVNGVSQKLEQAFSSTRTEANRSSTYQFSGSDPSPGRGNGDMVIDEVPRTTANGITRARGGLQSWVPFRSNTRPRGVVNINDNTESKRLFEARQTGASGTKGEHAADAGEADDEIDILNVPGANGEEPFDVRATAMGGEKQVPKVPRERNGPSKRIRRNNTRDASGDEQNIEMDENCSVDEPLREMFGSDLDSASEEEPNARGREANFIRTNSFNRANVSTPTSANLELRNTTKGFERGSGSSEAPCDRDLPRNKKKQKL